MNFLWVKFMLHHALHRSPRALFFSKRQCFRCGFIAIPKLQKPWPIRLCLRGLFPPSSKELSAFVPIVHCTLDLRTFQVYVKENGKHPKIRF